MSEVSKDVLDWIFCVFIAIILALLIKFYIFTPTIVNGSSMYPTLKSNERLALSRITRTFNKVPNRGDIITFEAPSVLEVSKEKANLDNPVAIYNYNPTNIFAKFTYYVLEWTKTSYIKRVIALPGEHVQIIDGQFYINGSLLDEPYLPDNVITTTSQENFEYAFTDIVVPENCVFACGDNRSASLDCRAFGCIPFDKIEGTVLFRFWPLDKFGGVEQIGTN